jgi:hypothetical protein
MVISSIDSERFVFVEECSSNTSLAPLYGWARKGERAHQRVPRNWGKNITLVSCIGRERGMGASLVVEGSTNGTVLQTYLEDVLLPTLKKGQVVMDNLSAHKGERVRELIEGGRGASSSTCRPIRRTITPSSKLSPSSRATSRRPALAAKRRSWRSSAKHSVRSLLLMPKASLNTAATGQWFNLYDRCSRGTRHVGGFHVPLPGL